MITNNLVISAYNCLKSYAYYENLNFFLKSEVARFERSNFQSKISRIVEFFENDNEDFIKWLNKIDVELLPKKIDSHLDLKQRSGALFLSNNKTADDYKVCAVNYLITAPVEIYIIETLWSIFVGSMLDDDFPDSVFGNRISKSIKKYSKKNDDSKKINAKNIFERYIDNYNRWRDGGINKAIEVIEKERNDVAILSLDLKGFYYNIDVDFDAIDDIIEKCQLEKIKELSLFLNKKLRLMHEAYRNKILPFIEETHPESTLKGIPIGFTSSAILANWYLSDFDRDIKSKVNPSYYGRYVDDILFVFSSPKIEIEDRGDEVVNFISRRLSEFIIPTDDHKGFKLTPAYHELPIQKDKLIFHFFNKDHSLAGLRVFKQEIESRSSAFRFLPEEHISSDLDKFAYDILFDGSVNKFRSIVGLAENETELSKYISSHILAHRLCNLPSNENTLKQITLFFKGENGLRFCRLWEKVLSYTLITRKYGFSIMFYKQIVELIHRVKWYRNNDDNISDINNEISDRVSDKLKQGIKEYIDISLCLNLALLDLDTLLGDEKPRNRSLEGLWELISQHDEMPLMIKRFRASNMIRHNLVSWPLANYTNYNGDLTEEDLYSKLHGVPLSKGKIEKTPRYIHADEEQLFELIDALHTNTLNNFTEENKHHDKYCSVESIKDNKALEIKIDVDDTKHNDTVKIALANMKVEYKDIESACRKDQLPNLSYERQKNLYRILNSATDEKVQILLLPELSIPVSWLPFMAAHSRRKQIALIFGLEHWVVNDRANNILVEMLPYTSHFKHKSSMLTFRVKNHYAPSEVKMLTSLRLGVSSPVPDEQKYHLIKWKNISFSTYNCFELANIEHRALFRSKLDILFASVWNKDINYYQHITESAARDLHCYVAQSNTSHYGGSCVLQPTSSTISNKIYVKGGENHCILTATLNIYALREAQYRSFRIDSDFIKDNPPGFDYDELLARGGK
ncbi:reverse transcriptase [Cronobacter turicensis]|nr:reverse transcriptase [Cronobacter turicensis]ELY4108683.1 reverse transcriptase [Cronobacter turicensis]ELY4217110.1 reverse transcriptase [Cronobacter turicensis]EMA1790662.1 reverse transcriptase [Cronobacter turicensis]EMA1800861.1 reverse transcriptase [Cronobacter turicensis]